MKQKIDLRSIARAALHYFWVYLLIALNGALVFVQNRNLFLYVVIALYAVSFLLYKRFRMRGPVLLSVFLLAVVAFVRLVSGGIGMELYLLYTGQILIAYLFYLYDREKALNRFLNMVLVFAVASLICWAILQTNRSFLENLLKAENYVPLADGRIFSYKGVLFYTLPTHALQTRNTGIYSEPGLYQAVLHGALFCCFFLRNRMKITSKKLLFSVVILILTILTTQSTTGYIGLFFLAAGYLFKNQRGFEKIMSRKLKQRLMLALALIAAGLIIDYAVNAESSFLSRAVFEKLSDTNIADISSSGGARLRMIAVSLQTLMSKPWGAGTFSVSGNTAAGGLFRFFAIMGIVPAIVVTVWIFSPFLRLKGHKVEFITFAAVYINIALGQTYAFYPALLMIPIVYRFSAGRAVEEEHDANKVDPEMAKNKIQGLHVS